MRHFVALAAAFVIVACALPFGAASPIVENALTPTLVGFATLAVSPTALTNASATLSPSSVTVGEKITLRELPGIGRGPHEMVMLGDKLYVSNAESDNLAVIQNGRAVKYVPVGNHPSALAVDSEQKQLYVGNDEDKTVNLIVNDAIVKTIGIGDSIGAMAFLDKYLCVGMGSKGTVLVLDPTTLQTFLKINVPNAEEVINMAADPERHQLFVNTYRSISVVDTKTWKVTGSFKVGGYYTLAVVPQKGLVLTNGYDADFSNQYLIAVDVKTGKEAGRAKIGSDPRGAVVTPDGMRAFVANAYSNDVTVVDTTKMSAIASISVGIQPQALVLDNANHRLYVSNSESDSISQIDTDQMKVVATIPVGMLPTSIIENESARRIYVANASSDSVWVIEGAKIVKEVAVGRHPIDLARDEESNRVLVANEGDRTLSIIDEADLSVRTSDVITRVVSTVAVDNSRNRAYVNDVALDLKTLKPVDRLLMRPYMVYERSITPDWVRVHPASKRLYLVAWNGTPGSNSRSVVYSVNGETLEASSVLANYGNATAITFDRDKNRTFLAGTHPLAYTNDLAVFDDKDYRIAAMEMPSRTVSMIYNPQTRHSTLR